MLCVCFRSGVVRLVQRVEDPRRRTQMEVHQRWFCQRLGLALHCLPHHACRWWAAWRHTTNADASFVTRYQTVKTKLPLRIGINKDELKSYHKCSTTLGCTLTARHWAFFPSFLRSQRLAVGSLHPVLPLHGPGDLSAGLQAQLCLQQEHRASLGCLPRCLCPT